MGDDDDLGGGRARKKEKKAAWGVSSEGAARARAPARASVPLFVRLWPLFL
jgi:hypothetical protein